MDWDGDREVGGGDGDEERGKYMEYLHPLDREGKSSACLLIDSNRGFVVWWFGGTTTR